MNSKVFKYAVISIFTLTLFIGSVSASEYINYYGIEMTEEEYDNLINLGFSQDEIYHMSEETFAQNKDIDITINMTTGDLIYPIERDSLMEAIYNITDNSIKYTESGGSVSIDLTHDSDNAYITIRDSGIGIPNEELEKIFDRFYRVDKARARDTGGTGLGLAIALDAVKLHGGNIEVTSEEELGSTFTIILPFKKE